MSTTHPNSFEEPELKAAVRRVWGGETAPAALRERVQAMGIGAASAPAADITPVAAGQRQSWTWPLRYPRSVYGLAAAAMMVIGFAVAYQLDQPPTRPVYWGSTVSSATHSTSNPSMPPAVLPASVAERLVDVHSRCARLPVHNAFRDIPRDDFDALRRRLENELGFPVLAGPIDGGRGDWVFRGGAICPVGQVPAAHLVFSRKGQAVSVFSLPRAAFPQANDDEVDEDRNPDHPLTVFVRPGGIHCIVGSSSDGSLSPEDLRLIGERLRPFLR